MNPLISREGVNSRQMTLMDGSLEEAEKSLREIKSEPQAFLLIRGDEKTSTFNSQFQVRVHMALPKEWSHQITLIDSEQNYEEWEKSIDRKLLLKNLQDSQIYLMGRICALVPGEEYVFMAEDDVLRRVNGQMECLVKLESVKLLSADMASFGIKPIDGNCDKRWVIQKLMDQKTQNTKGNLYFRIQAWSNGQKIGSTHYIDLPTYKYHSKTKLKKFTRFVASQNHPSIPQPVNHESFNQELLNEIQTLKAKIKELETQNKELQNRIQAWSNGKEMGLTNFVDLEGVRHCSATSQSHSMGLSEETKLDSEKSKLCVDIQRLQDRIKQLNEENQSLLQSAQGKDSQQLCDKIEELEKQRENNHQIIQGLHQVIQGLRVQFMLGGTNQELSKDCGELRKKKRKISSDI